MTTFAVLFPTYYVLKHRNTIYRATEINKFFYLKEVLMRSFLGACFGFGVSLYMYGGDKQSRLGKEFNEDGEEVDQSTLQYSTMKKGEFQRNRYLPGKIRE